MAEIAATANGATLNVTSHEFDLPDGITPGQLLVVWLCMDDTPTTGALTITSPAMTPILDNEPMGKFGGVVLMKGTIATRVLDGTETTLTCTTTNAESVAYIGARILEFDEGTPIALSGLVTFTGGSSGDPPSIASGWADALIIPAAFIDPGNGPALSGPSGYAFAEAHFSSNDGSGLAIGSKVSATGTEDPGVFTFDGFPDYGLITIAVKPGPDGPAPLAFELRHNDGTLVDGDTLLHDVSDAQAAAGHVDYALVVVHNADVEDGIGAVWIPTQPPYNALAVGVAVESAGDPITPPGSETTAPSGVTFSAPSSSGTALDIGTVPPGDGKGVWIRRTIPLGTTKTLSNPARIDFDVRRPA